MTCQAQYKSVVCPGPELSKSIKANSYEDFRCRPCKWKAGHLRQVTKEDRVDSIQVTRMMIQNLLERNRSTLSSHWAQFAEATLIDLFYDVCGLMHIPGNFALVVVGSLARREATALSDLEFFVVIEDIEHYKTFRQNTRLMYNILKPLYEETNAFGPDPVFSEMSPNITMDHRAYGKDSDHPKAIMCQLGITDNVLRTNLLGGRCVLGDPYLYEKLKEVVRTKNGFDRDLILKQFQNDMFDTSGNFDSVLHTWKGRKKHTVNIKKHVLRPCTWIITYLGAYHEISGTGSSLQLQKLDRCGYVSEEVRQMIQQTMDKGLQLRWHSHLKHNTEEDEFLLTDPSNKQHLGTINQCLDNVSSLMGISDKWIRRKKGEFMANFGEKPFRTKKPRSYRYGPFDAARK